ncbi:MAG: hypothetical protein O2854_04695 [Chloroflexi bacterium]|nr:hypothetical protein [Chloroflexota bacterium]
MAGLVIAGIAASCGGQQTIDVFPVRGRNLEIHVSRPIISKQIIYSYQGRVLKLEVPDPSRRLAAVQITVVNRDITFVPLTIDTETAEIGDSIKSQRFEIVDPADGLSLEGVPPEDGVYGPMLWDEIELTKGTQATGWLFFDVPVGLSVNALWWSEADSIIVRFSNPQLTK